MYSTVVYLRSVFTQKGMYVYRIRICVLLENKCWTSIPNSYRTKQRCCHWKLHYHDTFTERRNEYNP
jgi:hypothetical protein